MNPTGGARNGHGSEAETESSCGETLFEKMLQTENMSAAWKQVRANKGAAGIDGMSEWGVPRVHPQALGEDPIEAVRGHL